jgi:hypothetical protein
MPSITPRRAEQDVGSLTEAGFVRRGWPFLDHEARWHAVQAGRRMRPRDALRATLLALLEGNVVRVVDCLAIADHGHRARQRGVRR